MNLKKPRPGNHTPAQQHAFRDYAGIEERKARTYAQPSDDAKKRAEIRRKVEDLIDSRELNNEIKDVWDE